MSDTHVVVTEGKGKDLKILYSFAYDVTKLLIEIGGKKVTGFSAFDKIAITKRADKTIYRLRLQGGSASLPDLMPLLGSDSVTLKVSYPDSERGYGFHVVLNEEDSVALTEVVTTATDKVPLVELTFETLPRNDAKKAR